MRLILRTVRQILPLLPARARRFIIGYTTFSALLALLDTAALGLLAVSLTAMVSGGDIHLPLVGTVGPDGYIPIILVISGLIIGKSTIAIGIQWFATRRFSEFELEIGDRLFEAYIKAPWTDRLSRNTAQLVRLADVGIANTVSGFLFPAMTLPTLLVTTTSVLLVIIVAQPLTALVASLYLGLMALVLSLVVARKAVQAGRVNRNYSFRVATLMTDMVGALKEITLRDKAGEVARVVHRNRIHTTRARANVIFLGAVPRFVLDAALVGGFLLVGGVTLLVADQATAFAAVALFGVAGFRLVPSLTSLQSIVAQTHTNAPHVQAVIEDIEASREFIARAEVIGREPLDGEPKVLELVDVEYTYPGAETPALAGVSLRVPMGSTLGVVGSSGAGKSTLTDLLLGLLVPTGGTVQIDGRNLEDVLAAWRSRVGYVPQEVALFDGTIGQNVALDWEDDYDRDRVRTALERAQLWDFVAARPGGVDGRIGERGMTLSGGQRQRLGIARALYSEPLVLVMDEATSALDTRTEADVAAAIQELRGEVTIISVAHRLSTIRDNDQVAYMRDGRIVAAGSFTEVVAAVPEFAEQAALAGLR